MEIVFFIGIFVLGAVMGSFLACQAWRLHYKDLGKASLGKRSVCLSCKKQLKWFENIPIVSWLVLRGRCRYCKKKIGVMEILAEVLMGLAFLGAAVTLNPLGKIPLDVMLFVCVLLLMLTLGFLAIYDGMWGELPSFGLVLALLFAAAILAVRILIAGFSWGMIGNAAAAVAILGGLYLVLYLVSHGEWVGNGDWVLGTVIGLALGEAWLALIVLCVSNCLGLIVMYPTAKKNGKKKIYFGPFLAVAFAIVLSFAPFLMSLIF